MKGRHQVSSLKAIEAAAAEKFADGSFLFSFHQPLVDKQTTALLQNVFKLDCSLFFAPTLSRDVDSLSFAGKSHVLNQKQLSFSDGDTPPSEIDIILASETMYGALHVKDRVEKLRTGDSFTLATLHHGLIRSAGQMCCSQSQTWVKKDPDHMFHAGSYMFYD